jgi:putative MATE family efflux protein
MKRNIPWKMLPVVISLAWPTMLEQLLNTVVQYIDTIMVGQLGTQATAAVGGTGTVSWLINSTISALGVGFLACISQALGAGDHIRAKKTSAQALISVIVVGLFFTVLTQSVSSYIPRWMQIDPNIQKLSSIYFAILYSPMLFRTASITLGTVLRATGDSKTAMRSGIVVNTFNVVLNFFLIYPSRVITILGITFYVPGANLGVVGAGIASAIAYTVGGIVITIALLRHSTISPFGQELKPDASVLLPCLRVALPNALQRFATSFGYVVFASMINSLGEVTTAAHTIANTVESAFYIPGYGIQAASATLAGNAWGARDTERIHSLTRLLVTLEAVMMTISGAFLFIFAPQMMSVFNNDTAVAVLGTTVLRMVALSEPFYGISIVLEGMMQGMGTTFKPLLLNVSGMWIVRIFGTFICFYFFSLGLISAWACMICHNLLIFVFLTYFSVTGQLIPKEG